MFVYWSSCLISCVLIKFAEISYKRSGLRYNLSSMIPFFLSMLPLILVAALRYDVGQDYLYTYVPYFYRISGNVSYERLEPIYHALNVIVQKFSDDYVWVFSICAVLFIVLVYLSIIRDSPYPELSVFLLVGATYYFIFLNGMRQMVGISICLFSLRFIEKRNLVPFLICMAAAAGFHTSCIIFIGFYFIAQYKLSIKAIAFVTAVVIITAGLLSDKINQLLMTTAYSQYMGSRFDTNEQGYVVLAMNLLILIFAAIFRKKENKYQMYLNLQLIAAWIAILTGRVVLINRIRWMFGLPVIILLPMAVKNIKRKEIRIAAYIGIIILYAVYAQYTIGVMNGNNVLPYKTIFDRT